VDEVRASKEALRRRMREARLALDAAHVRAASDVVCRLVEALPAVHRAGTVALFAAIQSEIDLSALAERLLARGARLCFPRVTRPRLTFHSVSALDQLRPDVWQIPTPTADAPLVASEELDVVVVPALAFDRRGHRLGYGRGYYDGELAAAPRAVRVGVAYEMQVLDELPVHSADQPVDVIVTEHGARATGARPNLIVEVES
jgi:5-formyltetrahydrofolate cyclo-ligase